MTLVEEISTPPKSIEGAPTSTAGFVGIVRCAVQLRSAGPFGTSSELNAHLASSLPSDAEQPDCLIQAGRAFFAEGGTRLWIVLVGDLPQSPLTTHDFECAVAELTSVDEVSILAAPGATCTAGGRSIAQTQAFATALLSRALPARFAILDPPDGLGVDEVRAWRSRVSGSHAAVYYPWVRAKDANGAERMLPASSFVAGIYARVDREHGIFKAPANVDVRTAIGVAVNVTDAMQEALVADGINLIRYFPGHGIRVWGARTLSSGEWQYVNMRRYVSHLERSICKSLEWAVFEPCNELLWDRVKSAIMEFLHLEWRSGAMAGTRPDDGYFVRCDRTTMTQVDLDDGRTIVLVGFALVRPAEFSTIRISIESRARA